MTTQVRERDVPEAAESPAPERMIIFLEEASICRKACLSEDGIMLSWVISDVPSGLVHTRLREK